MGRISSFVCLFFLAIPSANAALTLGLLDDFEDGTLGGWAPLVANTVNVPGGPVGSTRFLQVNSSAKLAAFDAGINGVVSPDVTAISVDLFRSAGLAELEIRLVLFGPGTVNRWTSSVAHLIPGDGVWKRYSFSILPADLTQVSGAGSFVDLTNNLNRIMFRHDVGSPSAFGTPLTSDIGSFGIDNVSAVPLPPALWLFAGALSVLAAGGRTRWGRRGN